MTGTSSEDQSSREGGRGPSIPVADATKNNWVDRFAPHWAQPFLRLMRADRPIGFWLLFWPCAWSLTLAQLPRKMVWLEGDFLWKLALFFVGAVVMRGAGCVWNDITDRHIDGQVERTRSRPIPSGQVSVKRAIIFMLSLCLAGLIVLLQFNGFTIWLGFSSLSIVLIYPFMKRLTDWPQAILGLAFGWGALMGWASVFGFLSPPVFFLYAATICWIIGYDTIYAHQDREDDALIGMKSTALRFGDNTKRWLSVFFGLTIVFLIVAVALASGNSASLGGSAVLLLGMGIAAGLLLWQVVTLDIDDPDNCLDRFKQAHLFGAAVFLTLIALWFVEKPVCFFCF